MQEMVAVVAKSDTEIVLEIMLRSVTGKTLGPKLVTREVYAPGSQVGDVPLSRSVQVEAGEPMDFPASAQPHDQGLSLNALSPANVVRAEAVKVPAGVFEATLYRIKRDGEETDIWLAKDVMPLGIVRMAPHGLASATPDAMELIAQGDGARPVIVRPARPYDEATYRREMMAASGSPVF